MAKTQWQYTGWLKCGNAEPVGYTFGNYKAPEGSWGEVITVDDLRYTYLWGIDFRASNGAGYEDAQIQFYIDDAIAEIERDLNIRIKKTRIVYNPSERGLKKGAEYDEEEDYYMYRRAEIQRTGMIYTRKRPVLSVSRCDVLNRDSRMMSLLSASRIDHRKGRIEFLNRPLRADHSFRAVATAMFPYGAEMIDRNLCYAIDYVAGYETCMDVPSDLRQIVGKIAAVSLMNNIGRGLMSGFSSSSLSLDGASESFSSTQCATSAYYGADIKEYKSDIKDFKTRNKMKFGHKIMGCL